MAEDIKKTENTEENGGDGGHDKETLAEEKYLTQKEVDAIIADRLARERKKASKADKKEKSSEDDDSSKKNSEDESNKKITALEERMVVFEAGVSKDYVDDVKALARSYVDDETDFSEAVQKVLKKYPQLGKGAASEEDDDKDTKKKKWGSSLDGQGKQKDDEDGVLAAFKKKNPNLKI